MFQDTIKSIENWCYSTPLLSVLRDTKLGIPLVQTMHLVGITMVLGTLVVMNLRLLNLGYRALPARTFLPQMWIWFRRGLWITLSAGFIVFLPDPVRYLHNSSFQVKMCALVMASTYSFTIFSKAVRMPAEEGRPSGRTIAVSAASLLLWFGVGWCGRAIAFVG